MKHIDELVSRYPQFAEIRDEIVEGYLVIERSYLNGGKLLVGGNGGSAADAGHIVGELMKSFRMERPVSEGFARRLKSVDPVRGEILARNLECPLNAISLTAHESLITAYTNDVDMAGAFAQQLFGFGKSGDVFLGISTSGNSENVINAAIVARALEIKIVALTGADGGELARTADIAVKVPKVETYMVQELHLPIYHCWCMMLEEKFFGSQ